MGMKKLRRRDVLRKCPSFIIIEGSDLEPYRNASRSLYTTFRTAVQKQDPRTSARKGGMDETAAVDKEWKEQNKNASIPMPHDVWTYGDDSSVAQITEDQSGASVEVKDGEVLVREEKRNCILKMRIAAKIARNIQDTVKAETNFSTSIGVFSSPMLAKLASDLKKLKSCNILYPWRSMSIIATMPLRRVPDLGSRTLRSLSTVLKKYNEEKPW